MKWFVCYINLSSYSYLRISQAHSQFKFHYIQHTSVAPAVAAESDAGRIVTECSRGWHNMWTVGDASLVARTAYVEHTDAWRWPEMITCRDRGGVFAFTTNERINGVTEVYEDEECSLNQCNGVLSKRA